ncbi:MAG: 4Fe-4S binding protein [Thermodesulfovibrionales bacterium]|nr:4Fe-4S binding protein [Thermodesulfovibrionales bacterium]
MKRMPAILIVLCILFFSGLNAFGAGDHASTTAFNEFRIDRAAVKLRIEPETYTKGKTPQILITLTDYISGSLLLDAEIYIYLEKTGQRNAHAAYKMPVAKNNQPEKSGLEFGESPETATTSDISMFKKLQPQQMAGVYAVSYPIPRQGEYNFTIAIKSLNGKAFAEPLIYGGKISYLPKTKYKMLLIIGIVLISGVIAVWIMSVRKKLKLNTGQKINILDIPWIKRFFRSAWFQPAFQVPVLLIFLIIIAAGLFDIQKGDMNIATLLMWTIWWAAIIFTFVFVGRVWCMMCPFGAAQDWIGRLFSLNKDFPKPVRNIWLSSFIFFGLTWWDSFSGIVNKPALTSYLLIGFFVVAVGMSVTFKGRSFCRYACPIGGLIGLYSMFSPVELRNKGLEVCRNHKIKECIKGTEKSHPCPMFVTPMTLDRNNYCNFCSECIKSCSQDNIVTRFRNFAKDLWVSAKGYMDEAYLAIVILGVSIIVTGEMVEPWHRWMDAVGKIIPFDILGIMSHAAREKATFLIVMTTGSLIIPSLLLFGAALVVKKTAGMESPPLNLKQIFVQFAYMFIPVGLSMHLAHNVSHLLREGPGIIPAIQRAAMLYLGMNLGEPDWDITPVIGAESIFWLQMAIFMILNVFSLYAGYRIAVKYYGDKAMRAFIPMAALVVFFMALNTYILGQPMSPRHSH